MCKCRFSAPPENDTSPSRLRVMCARSQFGAGQRWTAGKGLLLQEFPVQSHLFGERFFEGQRLPESIQGDDAIGILHELRIGRAIDRKAEILVVDEVRDDADIGERQRRSRPGIFRRSAIPDSRRLLAGPLPERCRSRPDRSAALQDHRIDRPSEKTVRGRGCRNTQPA